MQLVLITGASAGAGLTLARQHAKYGNDLVLVSRRKKNLEAMKRELEGKYRIAVHVFTINLSSLGAAEELHKGIKEAGLDVDLLINNADFCHYDTTTSRREIEDPTAVLSTTVVTLHSLTVLFGNDMARRGGGTILNVGSAAAILNDPDSPDAIEDFVHNFSKNVEKSLRSNGVRGRIKSCILRNPSSNIFNSLPYLRMFQSAGSAEEKKIGNLKLLPSKHARRRRNECYQYVPHTVRRP